VELGFDRSTACLVHTRFCCHILVSLAASRVLRRSPTMAPDLLGPSICKADLERLTNGVGFLVFPIVSVSRQDGCMGCHSVYQKIIEAKWETYDFSVLYDECGSQKSEITCCPEIPPPAKC
jgi:hypothetical protein